MVCLEGTFLADLTPAGSNVISRFRPVLKMIKGLHQLSPFFWSVEPGSFAHGRGWEVTAVPLPPCSSGSAGTEGFLSMHR